MREPTLSPIFGLVLFDCTQHALAWPARGTINEAIVQPNAIEVIRFSTHDKWTERQLRYFTIVDLSAQDERESPDRTLAFTARGCSRFCDDGSKWLPLWETFGFTLSMRVRANSFDSVSELKAIVKDFSMSHNLVVKPFGSSFYAIGGQHGGKYWNQLPQSLTELRDGVRLLTSNGWDAIFSGAWEHPNHTDSNGSNPMIISGLHPNCISERKWRNAGRCEYDGRLSLVQHNGRWHVYARANLQFLGGRFTQVAVSSGSDIRGPYLPFRLIHVEGWDERNKSTNLYFTAVNPHPLDSRMLIATMPTNEGDG